MQIATIPQSDHPAKQIKMSAMFDCDLEFQEEKEFYPESEDDDLEVFVCFVCVVGCLLVLTNQ